MSNDSSKMTKRQFEKIIQRLMNGETLNENEIIEIIDCVKPIFEKQPMLLEIPRTNIIIAGDIHGQFEDLVEKILKKQPWTQRDQKMLFLGDYVDRGHKSVETITLLFAMKCWSPYRIFLLRGNHECESINRVYGFYDECKRKYSIRLWKKFTNVFNVMPAAAIIDNSIFCAHGGISKEITNLKDINKIKRPCTVDDNGILNDLLWSDPTNKVKGWTESDRGTSFLYGSDAVERFLKKHDLDLICRAHQVVEDGYEFKFGRKVVTVFSAPNYCGEFDNCGAIMLVDRNLFCTFDIYK